jgi:hypothetical protein
MSLMAWRLHITTAFNVFIHTDESDKEEGGEKFHYNSHNETNHIVNRSTSVSLWLFSIHF